MRRFVLAAAGMTAAALTAGSAAAALANQDRIYVNRVARADQYEVAVGQILGQHGASAAARKLGASLERGHGVDLNKLRDLAGPLGATLPDGPNAYQHGQLVSFANVPTAGQLDHVVAKAEITSQTQEIARARVEATGRGDARLKAFARASIPMLRAHLALAKAVLASG